MARQFLDIEYAIEGYVKIFVLTPKQAFPTLPVVISIIIDIFRADTGTTVGEIVEKYRQGKMQPIVSPNPAEESLIKQSVMTQ